ncbi:MAG: TRAP transporter TatT component family protein [Bacteroidales bacterium]
MSIHASRVALLLFLSSCTTFQHGWDSRETKVIGTDPGQAMAEAQQLEHIAATAEEVQSLISAFRRIEKVDPANYHALWKIGNYHILMGAAHSEKVKDKKFHYREAVKYCEKAMYTNKAFREAIKDGASITEASEMLTLAEIDAMGYWYTARFYYFSECLRPLGRLFNTRIVIENNEMIEQIDRLDPSWAGGGNYFARGLYFIAVPERFGGSKKKADEEFSMAIEAGPDYLVNRWGRAKYLYDLVGDTAGFYSDLEWVISQDPHRAGNPYPWNVYFQEDAKKLLAESQ